MKKLWLLLLILTLISNFGYADDNAIYLDKDQKAPYSGYLITPEGATQQRNVGIERDSYKLLNQSLTTQLDLESKSRQDSDKKVVILQNDLTNTTKALIEVKSMNDWEKAGFFVLGMVTTYFAIKTAHELYH